MNASDRFAFDEMKKAALRPHLITPVVPRRRIRLPIVGEYQTMELPDGAALLPYTGLPFDPAMALDARVGAKPAVPECTPEQNDDNMAVVKKIERRTDLARAMGAAAARIGVQTTSGREVEEAITNYNNLPINDYY